MSGYKLQIAPACFKKIKSLPGHNRQRIRKGIGDLANDPRLPQSKALNVLDIVVELRRLRLNKWRVLYAIT